MNKNILTYAILLLLPLLTGCRDDSFMPDRPVEDGERDLRATVAFEPLTGALDATRTPGDAIKMIESLAVILYDSDNTLVKVFNLGNGDLLDYRCDISNTDMPGDAAGADQSEAKTFHASFTLPSLPYGRYRIYAVANMGIITEETASDLKKLKNHLLEWNPSDIAANNQMFGYFTDNGKEGASAGFNAPLISVDHSSSAVHAWIKRAASKVTVAFDPSGLHQDVWIYIRDVTIRDIPRYCRLGADNTPGSTDSLLNLYDVDAAKLPEGSRIVYDSNGDISGRPGATGSSDYRKWMQLAKGSGIKGSDHSETANALYFYENMQGNYEGNPLYDKQQKKEDIGTNINRPGQPDYKDKVEFGTYIEVRGYYVSTNPQNTTSGEIKYRFMLGKDVRFDYNAQRNHHYKLTLRFRGWANQPDWHIEYYEEEPGLYVPDSFFVSYLYNQKHMMPIKVVGNCTNLRMEITENNWAPHDPNSNDGVPQQTIGSGVHAFTWNRQAWSKFKGTTHPYLGFLALRLPVNSGDIPKDIIDDKAFQSREEGFKSLQDYYEGKGGSGTYSNTNPQNWRSFTKEQLDTAGGTHGVKGSYWPGYNGWQVTRVDNHSKMLMIPIWTRNKGMINDSGFSGSNPYDSFMRKAVVRITATFNKGGKDITVVKDVPVYQVRRVVNPTGVWRSASNTSDFEVTLKTISKTTDNAFSDFRSEGAWKAFIETSNNGSFLKLADKSGAERDTIFGDTDSPIDFKLKFKGVGASTSACAVVTVLYHTNNCVHKILVRQGYSQPIKITGNTKWSSYTVYKFGDGAQASQGGLQNIPVTETVSPLALGSLFKRHNTLHGILADNDGTYGQLVAPNGGKFRTTSGSSLSWDNITTTGTDGNNTSWGTFKKGNTIYRLPTYNEFKALSKMEFGFGILYSDGATRTLESFDDVYGFNASGNTVSESDKPKGARGIFVYNGADGRQIFFPAGKSGMGRRSQFNVGGNTSNYGILRYSDVSDVLSGTGNNLYRPIPYNMPYTTGAIYWIDKVNATGHIEGSTHYPCGGWDMNYFAYKFGTYTNNNARDACPIKLVVK